MIFSMQVDSRLKNPGRPTNFGGKGVLGLLIANAAHHFCLFHVFVRVPLTKAGLLKQRRELQILDVCTCPLWINPGSITGS